MRVSKAGRHVEFEVVRVFDRVVAELDVLNALLLVGLLQQNRLQDRINLLAWNKHYHGIIIMSHKNNKLSMFDIFPTKNSTL